MILGRRSLVTLLMKATKLLLEMMEVLAKQLKVHGTEVQTTHQSILDRPKAICASTYNLYHLQDMLRRQHLRGFSLKTRSVREHQSWITAK